MWFSVKVERYIELQASEGAEHYYSATSQFAFQQINGVDDQLFELKKLPVGTHFVQSDELRHYVIGPDGKWIPLDSGEGKQIAHHWMFLVPVTAIVAIGSLRLAGLRRRT